MQFKTSYLGLSLPNPFVVGACPIGQNIEEVLRMEDAGAAAIVLHSLFEEQITTDRVRGILEPARSGASSSSTSAEKGSNPFETEGYLDLISALKERVGLPIIGSINGIHPGSWVQMGESMVQAGVDALELNLYFLPRSDNDRSEDIEASAAHIVFQAKQNLTVPLAVKLTPFYTGLPRFTKRLEEAGASAIVLFNSFFQPDIDVDKIAYAPKLHLTEPNALLLRTRWAASLYGRVNLDLSISGGVHTAKDSIKAFMAGAGTVQLVSCLLNNGPQYLRELIENFEIWMEANEFESIEQLRGILSFMHVSDTESLARASYLETLRSWRN